MSFEICPFTSIVKNLLISISTILGTRVAGVGESMRLSKPAETSESKYHSKL